MLSKLTVALSALAVGVPSALVGGVDALGYVGVAAIAALDRDVLLRSRTLGGSRTLTLSFPKRRPPGKGRSR
jgi:hypothetical protein